jgi:hypothetical protein
MVHTWTAFAAPIFILTPTLLSMAIMIAWPIVAVKQFGLEAQASIQTATGVASYIVTAGK